MAIEPLSWKIAKSLIACLCAELAANFVADPTLPMPKRCCLRAGSEILMDVTDAGEDLCCSGEAYVKVISIYPSAAFPEPDQPTATPCQMSRYTMALELGVLRCIPDSATCTESDFAVRRAMADGEAAFRAACCWGADLKTPQLVGRGVKWFAGGWDIGGPDGLCVTGTMPLFVSLPGPGCC